jgi:hypothetical protein
MRRHPEKDKERRMMAMMKVEILIGLNGKKSLSAVPLRKRGDDVILGKIERRRHP